MSVLVLNSGSSSLKFQLIATDRERMEATGRMVAGASSRIRAFYWLNQKNRPDRSSPRRWPTFPQHWII